MQRNSRNQIEFRDTETGEIIEVNSANASEIMLKMSMEEKPRYVPVNQPAGPGLEKLIDERIEKVLEEKGLIGGNQVEATSNDDANSDPDPDRAELTVDDVKEVVIALREKAVEGDGTLNEKGNPKKAAVEDALGGEVSQSMFLQSLK